MSTLKSLYRGLIALTTTIEAFFRKLYDMPYGDPTESKEEPSWVLVNPDETARRIRPSVSSRQERAEKQQQRAEERQRPCYK